MVVLKWCIFWILDHRKLQVNDFFKDWAHIQRSNAKGCGYRSWSGARSMCHTFWRTLARVTSTPAVTKQSLGSVCISHTFSLCRSKDDFIKDFTFWFVFTVVDCFRFLDLSIRSWTDLGGLGWFIRTKRFTSTTIFLPFPCFHTWLDTA